MSCCGMRMRATARSGDPLSFHSTGARPRGILCLSGWNWIMKSKEASEVCSRLLNASCRYVSVSEDGFELLACEQGLTMYLTARPCPNKYGVVLQYGISRWLVGFCRACSSMSADRGCAMKY